jgi:microcystin-dependent protein
MAPYVGEVRMFAGNFAPAGWAFCDGAILAISENDTLFNLIGTTYGGDGQETFALPNLASRVPVHMGTNVGTTYQIGEMAGTEQETLSVQQIPAHIHNFGAQGALGTADTPGGNVPAQLTGGNFLYREVVPSATMNPAAQGMSGGSQPHDNTQPFLCINFIISLFGVYPSPT